MCAFPDRFQDLGHLTDPDPELDFFNNVAHLQLHRRSRAFYRLKKVSASCFITHWVSYSGVRVFRLKRIIACGPVQRSWFILHCQQHGVLHHIPHFLPQMSIFCNY